MTDFDITQLENMLIEHGLNIVLALITLILGFWIVKKVVKLLNKITEKREFDAALKHFLNSFVSISLKVLVVITAAGVAGIPTTSFLAILGAAGLAIGLALQGSLSNFAGGVLLLILKPFKIGDFIESGSNMGTVHSIRVFNTTLKTPDNKTVIIPNSQISNASIINYSTEANRRVDMVFGISYSSDIDKTKEILNNIADSDTRVLAEPTKTIVLSALADSSVNFNFRVWVKKEDFWAVYFDTHEKVKKEFDKNGIEIPFPQRDIHINNKSNDEK